MVVILVNVLTVTRLNYIHPLAAAAAAASDGSVPTSE
jgi:hypothetical protein